jgi:hypothetical protein
LFIFLRLTIRLLERPQTMKNKQHQKRANHSPVVSGWQRKNEKCTPLQCVPKLIGVP